MPPRRRPPEQPAPTASIRTSVEPRHTPHRRPVLVCQHISTSLNIVAQHSTHQPTPPAAPPAPRALPPTHRADLRPAHPPRATQPPLTSDSLPTCHIRAAIINILSPQLSCSHTERVTSPADARTKRLFASGVPVRSRARMKTQSCKALKRDVPHIRLIAPRP